MGDALDTRIADGSEKLDDEVGDGVIVSPENHVKEKHERHNEKHRQMGNKISEPRTEARLARKETKHN